MMVRLLQIHENATVLVVDEGGEFVLVNHQLCSTKPSQITFHGIDCSLFFVLCAVLPAKIRMTFDDPIQLFGRMIMRMPLEISGNVRIAPQGELRLETTPTNCFMVRSRVCLISHCSSNRQHFLDKHSNISPISVWRSTSNFLIDCCMVPHHSDMLPPDQVFLSLCANNPEGQHGQPESPRRSLFPDPGQRRSLFQHPGIHQAQGPIPSCPGRVLSCFERSALAPAPLVRGRCKFSSFGLGWCPATTFVCLHHDEICLIQLHQMLIDRFVA